MLTYTIIWVASVVGAVIVANRIPWWLTWRLFLIVPLFGEIALWSPLTKIERPITLPMLAEPNTWGWILVFYVYGLIQYGPSVIVLGGLGSSIIKARPYSLMISKSALILAGTVIGAIIGGSFQIGYGMLLGSRLPIIAWIWHSGWVLASVVSGAAGGFIVAYYAATVPSNGGDNAPIIGDSHASV